MKLLVRILLVLLTSVFVLGITDVPLAAAKEERIYVKVKMQDKLPWYNFSEGEDAGTTGQSRRIEGISLGLYNRSHTIKYRIYTHDKGWSEWKADGENLTNGGGDTPITALQICAADRNTGVLLDIEYRVHIAFTGWLEYVGNNVPIGNYKDRIEAITVRFPNRTAGSVNVDAL